MTRMRVCMGVAVHEEIFITGHYHTLTIRTLWHCAVLDLCIACTDLDKSRN